MKRLLKIVIVAGILSFTFTVQAAISIDNSDIPTAQYCCGASFANPDFALEHNPEMLYGCQESATGNRIDAWARHVFGDPIPKNWSPNVAGVYIATSGQVIVRFVLSDNDHEFLSRKFNNSDTRVPFALEIDILDYDGIYGTKGMDDFNVKLELLYV